MFTIPLGKVVNYRSCHAQSQHADITYGASINVITSVKSNKLSLRSGYCYLHKGECNWNQSKDDSFVERVAKNNSWNNAYRRKIHEIFLISCFVYVITLVWKTVHSSAMTQIKAHVMEKTLQLAGPVNSPCFSWLNKETHSPLCYLEIVFLRSPNWSYKLGVVSTEALATVNVRVITNYTLTVPYLSF